MPVRFRLLPAPRGSTSTSTEAAGPLVARDVEISGAPVEIRIGRGLELELPLPFPALSALHARVVRTADGWVVQDEGSTNGTWLGGARLAPGERRALAPGDELRLANVVVRFDGEAAPSAMTSRTAEGTATIARRLVDDLFAASPAQAPTLRVLRGAPARRLALTEPGHAYVAGRSEACALPLEVEEVSREHATFTRAATGVVVRDLGSKNGVQLEGTRLEGERVLRDGDVVEIGPVSVTLDDPVGRYLRELEAAPPEALAEPAPVTLEPAPPPPEDVEPAALSPRRTTRLPLIVGGLALALLAAVAVLLVVSSR
jgi:pSer/pThr/pTyr-binding forkhead associated (FHA) protein